MSGKPQRNDDGRALRISPWLLRIPVSIILGVTLIFQFDRISGFGSALIYAASWIVMLHVLIGEYVFVRYLRAVSRVHLILDFFAALLFLGAILSFHHSGMWCAFLAGAFALAIIKYLLVEQHVDSPQLLKYAKEKIWWESPAVCLFSALAVLISRLPTGSSAVRWIETGVLVSVALFAIWMIVGRHLYRNVAQSQNKAEP